MAKLSEEYEAYIDSKVTSGQFVNREAVLEAAIDRFKQVELIAAHVMEGVKEIERGEGQEYSIEELDTLFERFIVESILQRQGHDSFLTERLEALEAGDFIEYDEDGLRELQRELEVEIRQVSRQAQN